VEARQMNPFIVHSSLDIVDEMQWLNNQMCVSPTPTIPMPSLSNIILAIE